MAGETPSSDVSGNGILSNRDVMGDSMLKGVGSANEGSIIRGKVSRS